VVNVPHATNKRAQLKASVSDDSVYVRIYDAESPNFINSTGVCDMFIGDHMFAPDMRHRLRMMVGEALIVAIEQARDAGYSQAQSDIRRALGIKDPR
jgi:hypothetical protein